MIHVFIESVGGNWFAVACIERQVVATAFADLKEKALSNLLNNLPFNVPFQVLPSSSICAKETFALMKDMLEGKDVSYHVDFAFNNLSKYSIRVLKAVMQIPSGYLATYGAVAKAVGGGPRAVGNIMAGNIFIPLIPCHRVVKADFSLGGYGGGLRTKYYLLMNERRGYFEHKDIVINDGGMLRVYPVEEALNKASLIQFF
jgi:O-6-methylguanine DNA methyltransferase